MPADLILLGLSALCAAAGSFILWKYYALPKISRWFVQYSSDKLRAWVKRIIDDPEGADAQEIGRLGGVAFSYLLNGVLEDIQDPEGRKRWLPIFDVIQQHIMQSVFASWGHISNKLRDEGMAGGGLPNIPPQILGFAGRMLPKGVELKDLLPLLQWFSQMGGAPGSLSSPGASPAFSPGGNGGLQAPR